MVPEHIGWTLWRATLAWRRDFVAEMTAAGHGWFAQARGNIVVYIGPGGVRQGDLADRAHLTKQAVQQFVPVPHLQADVDSWMLADESRQCGAQRRFDRIRATANGHVTRFKCPPRQDLLAEVRGQLGDLTRSLDQQASEVRWYDATAGPDEEARADMLLEVLDAT